MRTRTSSGRYWLIAHVTATCLTLLTGRVVAEEVADNRIIEEIVVVSTKRAQGELSQDVPVASTVVSSAMIEENNFIDLVDVAQLVPGADFRQTATFPGIQRFWLRAVGVSFSVPNFDPAVGVYQDGVFVAQNIAAILDTFDMESVEVLRGPQGTLFGRNTSVGAVVTRSRRPGDEYLLRAQATLGSFDRKDYSVSVEGPVIEGKVAAKLALQSRDRDGWLEDLVGGPDIGEFETTHARTTFLFTPSDAFDFTLIGEYYERDGDGAISAPLGQDSNGRANNPFLPGVTRDWDQTYGVGSVTEPWGTFSDHEITKLIGEANWDLGHGVLTSVTGYIDVTAFSGGFFDGLPPDSLQVLTRLYIDQEQFSQELRYASSFSDTFDFTAGLFFFDQHLSYGEQRQGSSRVTPTNPFGLRPPGHDELDHDSFAVFAEARFHLSEKFSLTVGGRYTDESKDVKLGLVNSGSCSATTAPGFETDTVFFCLNGPAPGGWDVVDDESWKSFSPKIGVQYHANDDLMLYSSITRGFRSGGFSFRASSTEIGTPGIRPAFYDEERVDSLEIGMKSDLYDKRIRLNVNAFYQWWDGIQRNLQQGPIGAIIQRTANVDDSHVYGIEAEINAIVALDMFTDGDMLRIDGSVGLAESGYDSDDYVVSGQNLSDQEFGAPHNTAFLGVTYEHPVGSDGGSVSWRASYYYKEGWWSEGIQRPTRINEYNDRNIVDASIQYTSADGSWYAKLFGRNLTYDENYAARVPFADTFGLGNPENPRTFGLTVGFEN